MTNKYMITLSGGGDTDVFFVDKPVFDWINSGIPAHAAGKGSWVEKMPGVENDDEDNDPFVTIGSYDNDRAIYAGSQCADRFSSVGDGLKYAKRQNFNIVDTYEGMIY